MEQNLLSVGGYLISLLLGIVVFLMKREIARYDELQKQHVANFEESMRQLRASLKDIDFAYRERWEKHAEKHAEEQGRFDTRREVLNEAIQKLRTEQLEHCAESNDRFLTKDEFVSSTAYLTKKTDEVGRLLQSIENILARR